MKKILLSVVVVCVAVAGFLWVRGNGRYYVPSGVQTGVINNTKPASLEGVEMTMYKSPYGYEITYPKTWVVRKAMSERPIRGEFESYGISSTNLSEDGSSVLVIGGWEDAMQNQSLEVTGDEQWLTINGVQGVYAPGPKPGPDGSESYGDTYRFVTGDKHYTIFINIPAISKYGLSKEEALWVLSTFKVLE